MRSDGVTMPILVDEAGVIIAGHGRLLAAQANGFEEYPVVIARGWSEEQKRATRIKDNQRTLQSGWDYQLIRGEVAALKTFGYDIELLGFEPAQLVAFSLGIENGTTDPNQSWSGMPEFDQQDKTAFRSIVVHFKDQAAVDEFAAVTKQKVTPNTRFLWYPKIEIETMVDKSYKGKP